MVLIVDKRNSIFITNSEIIQLICHVDTILGSCVCSYVMQIL